MAGAIVVIGANESAMILDFVLLYGFYVLFGMGPVVIWAVVTRMLKSRLDMLPDLLDQYKSMVARKRFPDYTQTYSHAGRTELRGRILEIQEGYKARYTGWAAVLYYALAAFYALVLITNPLSPHVFHAAVYSTVFVAAGGWFTYVWAQHQRRQQLGTRLIEAAHASQ